MTLWHRRSITIIVIARTILLTNTYSSLNMSPVIVFVEVKQNT